MVNEQNEITAVVLIPSLDACGRLPMKLSKQRQSSFASPSFSPLFAPFSAPPIDNKTRRTYNIKDFFDATNITDEINGERYSNETADAKARILQNWNRGYPHTCIPGQQCSWHSQCGNGGCIYGRCRCSCVESIPCFMKEHCFGYPCADTCKSVTGFATDCNWEDQCARGTQCLVGVCVGGGRLNAGMYEAVSCSIFTEKIDCFGVGKEECAIIGDLCIRHYNASQIGHERGRSICNNGISSSVGFPTCVSAKGRPIKCGTLNMCAVEGHCGSCECDDTMYND